MKIARITSEMAREHNYKLIFKASVRKDTITSSYILCHKEPYGYTKIKEVGKFNWIICPQERWPDRGTF